MAKTKRLNPTLSPDDAKQLLELIAETPPADLQEIINAAGDRKKLKAIFERFDRNRLNASIVLSRHTPDPVKRAEERRCAEKRVEQLKEMVRLEEASHKAKLRELEWKITEQLEILQGVSKETVQERKDQLAKARRQMKLLENVQILELLAQAVTLKPT